MAKLEVKNLTISFRTTNGAVRAVRDVSFDLQEGETLAIAGESGSGKSVTTRAVMGILAGNAMVDGGEIIYDGKDLLKIPEEEFHNLRGHRLAMVFQDPLSALNPVMRIGRQLTEAMLLNNKERRRDGRESFNRTLKTLQEKMTAEGSVSGVEDKIKEFDSFVKIAVRQEFAYKEATESMVEVLDGVDEANDALIRRNDRDVREACGRMLRAMKHVYNPYTFAQGDPLIASFTEKLGSFQRKYTGRQQGELGSLLQEITDSFDPKLKAESPNFFCIGYSVMHGRQPDPAARSIPEINREARRDLDEGFMLSFRKDVEKALEWSEKQSLEEKKKAVEALKAAMPVFGADSLAQDKCAEKLKESAAAVERSIDPLRLEKDNQAYVYRSGVKALLERYFRAFRQNPREEARYKKDTERFERDKARGKTPPSVIPMNLIDIDAVQKSLTDQVSNLVKHYESQIASGPAGGYDKRAEDMIDYLKARAEDYAFKLSQGMARHRAIELMKEVGIPEPHKRYRQYPFEFSGGMRQRIVIAIALSANPDILICDEPTTALDVTIQAQILELINRLKKERRLSVIFITHDLGVVANMADKIAIMYAGKIVEYGTADDVFYDPRHPYTWALLSSMPDLETKEKLEAIPGTPPDMILPPQGDAFAARNKYAMQIDFEEQPPVFRVSPTHWAATWLLHPDAPHVEPPAIVTDRIRRMQEAQKEREMKEAVKGGTEA